MEEITTPNPVTEGGDPAPVDPVAAATDLGGDPAPAGEGADGSGNSISLEALSEALGKDFKDVDGALKSVKDTFSYVGSQAQFKEQVDSLATALGTDEAGVLSTLENLATSMNNDPKEDPVEPAPTGDFVTREELDENNFFAENKELADLQDVLSPLKDAHGQDMSWAEFAQTDQAKKVIEPITGFREMEQQKSALESNSRLGAATDTMSDARKNLETAKEAAKTGDVTGAAQAEGAAREGAVAGVMEAFDIK